MVNIDYIMELLDCDNSKEEQLLGIKLARNIEIIEVFLQPGPPYGKRVWDKCAEILSEKTDEELSPYLVELMEWLKDMDWPGAYCVLERLKRYKDSERINLIINRCMKEANALDNDIWLNNLKSVIHDVPPKKMLMDVTCENGSVNQVVNIDYIMELLKESSRDEEQALGIRLAQEVKCLRVFCQPSSPFGIDVWGNCAKILSGKTDEELLPYLVKLMEWLQFMNWPGAFCILERLRTFEKNAAFRQALNTCVEHAKVRDNNSWEENLRKIC